MPDKRHDQQAAEWGEIMRKEHDTMRRIALVAFSRDSLKDPEDALTTYGGISEESYRRWAEKHFTALVMEAAKATGADPAQIADKNTRTEEQQKALLEASARDQVQRIDAFFSSNYMQAFKTLDPMQGRYEEPADDEEIGLKETAVLYFFATHEGVNPTAAANLTSGDVDELKGIYTRLDNFYTERTQEGEKDEGGAILEAFIKQESPTEALEIIPRLFSVTPKKHVIPNTKLANHLTRDIIDVGTITLEVSRRGAKTLVETVCILTYEGDNVKLSGRQPFTEYDRNVYNAVTSLYVYGDQQHIITPAMVYRAMAGLTDNEKPTPQQIEAVTKSLDKMRFIRARIDCTAELKMRRAQINGQQINSGEIDTYLLTAEAVKVNAGGNVVTGYHIIKTPILYEYAAAVKQVLTVSTGMLDIKKLDKGGAISTHSLAYTEQRVTIRGYLIRRIEGMKGKNGLASRNIALDDYAKDGEPHSGLYSIAGCPSPTAKQAFDIRADATAMLNYWKAAGYIKGYAPYKTGKAIAGYTIDP